MKNLIFFLTIVFSLFCFSAYAQSKPDFSGEWIFDKTASKMSISSVIESITIKARQTANEIEVETKTRFLDGADDPVTSGGPRVVRVSVGDGTVRYVLNGQEIISEADTLSGKTPIMLKGYFEKDGKLNLSSKRTITSTNGEILVLTQETWELADDGNTLTIVRETKAPNGTRKIEMNLKKTVQ
jgi:hypothetical protein